MVTKKKKQSTTEKRGKAKVSTLKLNKETVKNLTDSEAGKIKGGARVALSLACGVRGGRVLKADTDICSIPKGCVSFGCMTKISALGNGCCS